MFFGVGVLLVRGSRANFLNGWHFVVWVGLALRSQDGISASWSGKGSALNFLDSSAYHRSFAYPPRLCIRVPRGTLSDREVRLFYPAHLRPVRFRLILIANKVKYTMNNYAV